MQSSHCFLQFQGANSVEMGMVYIAFRFVDSGPGLELAVAACGESGGRAVWVPYEAVLLQ